MIVLHKKSKNIPCDVCGNNCAKIVLLKEFSLLRGTVCSLLIKGFIGDTKYAIKKSNFNTLLQYFEKEAFEKIQDIDQEYASFYCKECKKCYCTEHWTRQVVYEDGFYDETRGICPNGHEKRLDD
ncbi:hypothetical protein [Aquimarina algicola]|uniref:Uncharacterized protein n=1 Tax=Aquimarina algicola TaxID=2589995 RepID=A0A504JEB4_9FLAO|nr:hypothetical protein [Aquimarina algicola]TPN89044.1 hypothetical protein FHK87_02160 [Aquimarina algicola]